MDLDILSSSIASGYKKDLIALSGDLVDYFKSDTTRQMQYLNDSAVVDLDGSRQANAVFARIQLVNSHLTHYFGSKNSVAESIEANILKGIKPLTAEENMPFGQGKMSCVAYYDFLRGVLSNASIPASDIRYTTFTVLSSYTPDRKYSEMYDGGQLICVDVVSDMLLKPNAINNVSIADGILSNRMLSRSNYSTSAYMATSSFISLLNQNDPWTKYILGRPTPLSFHAQIGNYDDYDEFSISNETNCLLISQIDEFCKNYISALTYIKDNKPAVFVDPRTALSVWLVYHAGKAVQDEDRQLSTYVHAYSFNDLLELSDVFGDLDEVFYRKFLGWTISANEASDIRLWPGIDKAIVQDRDLHLWAAYPPMIRVTYDRNNYKILAGSNGGGWDTNTHLAFNGEDYKIRGFGVVGSADKNANSLVFVDQAVRDWVVSKNIFRNYSTNKNATTGNYSIGQTLRTSQDITLYPIFNTHLSVNPNIPDCAWRVNYGKNTSVVVTRLGKTGSVEATEWPKQSSVNLYNSFGPLLKYATRIRVLFSGNINERAKDYKDGTHATDKPGSGYCKVLANLYSYDNVASIGNPLNSKPIFAFEYYSNAKDDGVHSATDPARFSFHFLDSTTMKYTQVSEWVPVSNLKNYLSVGLVISAYSNANYTAGSNGYFGIRGLTVDFN